MWIKTIEFASKIMAQSIFGVVKEKPAKRSIAALFPNKSRGNGTYREGL
jgi:hypothetical protein